MDRAYRLPRAERLRSLTLIRELFSSGVSGFVYPLRYMVITTKSTTPGVEVLFSVPKRYHKRANKRNTLRRRMKESYRLHKSLLSTHAESQGLNAHLALVYSSKEVLPYKTIEHAIERILQEVFERC